MFEVLTVILFIWLMAKAISLALRLTWGTAKIIASILMGLALPVLLICLVFVGGIALMVPLAVIGMALGILKICE